MAAIGCLVLAPQARAQGEPVTIGLEEALEIAREHNGLLRAATLRIDESRGDVVAAAVRFIENPAVSLETGPRSRATGGQSTDWGVGLAQRFELRGQRRSRMRQAESLLEASEHEAEDARRVVALGIALSFFEAVAKREHVTLSEEGESLARTLLELAQRRLEGGEGTPLELNTARLRSALARSTLLDVRAAERRAVLRLKELMGINAAQQVDLMGSLPSPAGGRNEESLVMQALANRPDSKATEQLTEAAHAAIALADARSWPGLQGGLAFEREEGDEVFLGTISVPLPFANRNRGERQRARATEQRLKAESDAAKLRVEIDVRSAFTNYEQARDQLALYDADVLAAQEESLGLLERAFAAGEVSYAEVLVVQREVLEARSAHLNARLAFAQSRAALLAAAHLPQIDPPAGNGGQQ